jgi:hypothetical protein
MTLVRCPVITLLAFAVSACASGAADQATVDAASSPPAAAAERTEPSEPSEPATGASPSPLEPSEGFDIAEITLSNGNEQIRMRVWVAADAAARQRGLMGRESLPPDAGMVFVFEAPTVGGFWMKDTLIPLSIAFIDESGQVLQILDMEPCTADPCEIYTPDPGSPYLYALEANRGYFDDRGIEPGWMVDLDDAVQGAK